MAKNPKILSIVLAGGEGTRLMPLTRDRAKPAVPFGGVFRLIDFPLSNLVNSGICRPWCSPSTSPIRLTVIFPRCGVFRRCSATTSPLFRAQQRLGKHWYLGSADAIYQTINIIEDVQPDIVVIVGADTSTAWISNRWCSSISNPARSSRWRVFASRSASPTSSA